MSDLTEKDVLVKARSLIKGGWVKGQFAQRNERGRICYCAVGALRRAAGGGLDIGDEHVNPPLSQTAYEIVLSAQRSLHRGTGFDDVVSFNDDSSTTRKDVLAAFNKAIEEVSA